MNNAGKTILIFVAVGLLIACLMGKPYPQNQNYKLAVCYYGKTEKSFKLDDYRVIKGNIMEIKKLDGTKRLISMENCYLSTK